MFSKNSKAQDIDNRLPGYDSQNQFRPKINKGDFFKLSGFDFGWLLLDAINIAESKEKEPDLTKRFSSGQKALYFWWYLDGQVTNGGFVQFYYNGYGDYVPAIIEGLEHIGDGEMTELLMVANEIYLDNRKFMDEARKKNLFGSELYERFQTLGDLDSKYYEIHAKTMSLIEKYARQNPNEFCVDEDGHPFEQNYTGKCTTTFDNGKIKEEFSLANGESNGEFKTFFETGRIKSLNTYLSGEQVGEQKYWYESGNLKKIITIDYKTKEKKIEYYYENGQIFKLEHTDSNDERKGEYKEWYQNGQLKEHSTFIAKAKRTGDWLKFWESGNKQLEAEVKDGEVYFHNYWNERGEQLLNEGTGLYINEFEMDMFSKTTVYRYETEYKSYKRHGVSKSFTDGILGLTQEFKAGVEHGVSKNYDENGELKEEKEYDDGKLVSTKTIKK